jgi:hypothetical protein
VRTVALELYTDIDDVENSWQMPQPLEIKSDLGAVFPNASKLKYELTLASGATEAACALTAFPRICPSLTSRLQHVSLELQAEHLERELCSVSLARFLAE